MEECRTIPQGTLHVRELGCYHYFYWRAEETPGELYSNEQQTQYETSHQRQLRLTPFPVCVLKEAVMSPSTNEWGGRYASLVPNSLATR